LAEAAAKQAMKEIAKARAELDPVHQTALFDRAKRDATEAADEAEIARAVGGFRSPVKGGRLVVGPATDITVMSTPAAGTAEEVKLALDAAKSAETARAAAVMAEEALRVAEAARLARAAEVAAEGAKLFRFIR
jgi:hypothetical protein